jgi:general secretion pathway protein N
MRDLFQRQPLAVALAAAAILLLVVIGFETGFGSRLTPSISTGVSRPAAPFQAKLMPPLAAAQPEALYPEMAARPLFVPLRRPAPAAEQAPASNMKKGQFVLQGVTIAGDTKIALLREKSTGHIHRIEKGRELNGMKLAEVSPESVTLAQGSEQEVLPLQVMKPGPGAHINATGPFGPAGGVVPTAPGAPTPANPNPLAAPPPPGAVNAQGVPMQTFPQQQLQNPIGSAVPQATTAPLTPEELLARRRARRSQQPQ